MSRWRIVVVALLILGPVLALAVAGSIWLWREGLGFALWWPMAACVAVGYFLAWHWQRKKLLLAPADFTPPAVSTERDRAAWTRIEARAKAAAGYNADRLGSVDLYIETARELAQELAVHYHPKADDPFGSLTVPEMLTVVELAAYDLHAMVERYLPGGHLLTVRDWRRARQAVDWYQKASNVVWAVSALFAPVNTALRYVASRFGLSGPSKVLQQDLLLWFYTAYVHRVGFYLIELYSGRLRVGVKRWRELVQGAVPDGETVPEPPRQTGVALVGQVSAGKSSMVNALLGKQEAETDILPTTSAVKRYRLRPEGGGAELDLFDTPGYGDAGPDDAQVRQAEEAARLADVILLVMHARNPARAADVQMLDALAKWFDERPDLRMPPVIGVLTHIDLLSPVMEWSPPYDWKDPKRPKEQSIRQALEVAQEQLGDRVVAVMPVCTAPGKVHGIEEWLLPVIVTRLDEGRAVAVLRCLHQERDTGNVRRVFSQLLEAGKGLLEVMWQTRR